MHPLSHSVMSDNKRGVVQKSQAVDDVKNHLVEGKTDVIDADISKYFDTIPHDKLMQLVAKRIVDKHILRLVKVWLRHRL